ncbi:beta-ketoacyl synthase N-terminal-like domain-containing protein [Micromonospora haikouensis]|uniref:beta-ketoacyl synthase N-terminal-like domain-containing protein n=1 Tax=Micromonospora haikouensis TaxID=686309 RepID=UPI003D7329B9
MSADTDIAIVGAAARFPDAADLAEFWANLDAGRVSTREIPADRGIGADLDPTEDPDVVRVAATVDGIDRFAAEFFGYTPAQAELLDPAQRILLEVCWHALESAAHPPTTDGPLIGVFVGGGASPYSSLIQASMIAQGGRSAIEDTDFTLGNSVDFLASRVAYKLGLRGPSVAVSTACSSSLTAVHYAVLSLLSGECDIALAGGTASAEPLTGYRFVEGGIMSRDGVCRPFDIRSSGTGAGAGTGIVVLRRRRDAEADGDDILALIRGSAVGNDGSDRPGFTAPSPAGVASTVAAALTTAGLAPGDLRYVEAHGSGTALGDRIELRGITAGLKAAGGTVGTGYCGLGSVKANIGHASWAAGVAGLLKAVHVARTGRISPHPTFRHPRDPGVLAESPFYVPRELTELAPDAGTCHVLVNSMGLGGVNAAVVVSPPAERAATDVGETAGDGPVRLVLSARTRAELDELSRGLADQLADGTVTAADAAHTLRVGRKHFTERRVVTATPERLVAALRMPRPPFVRTERVVVKRAAVAGARASDALATKLRTAFGGRLDVLAAAPAAAAPDRFVIVLAGPDDPDPSGEGLTVLPVDAGGDAVPADFEAALTAAWLGGADVDFGVLPAVGRRRQLPVYPFTRGRYWALDRLAPPGQPAQRQAAPTPVAAWSDDDPIEAKVRQIWVELFGVDDVGPDDEFGQLGGSSLLSVRLALEIQQRLGVLVNLHRAGGSRSTVRRLAQIIASGAGSGEAADGDEALVDQDIAIDLGELNPTPTTGTEVLLTGATGYVGAFLLHHLQRHTAAMVHCVVRGSDEADAWRRLDAAAEHFALPSPDRARVRVVVGDLVSIGELLDSAGLAPRIGHVVHCAARVVFTEPYRVLRSENVLASVELVKWMRRSGVVDLSFVSSLAATAPSRDGVVTEERAQPLDPEQGGYGVSKWVMERVLARAELDGMRVRVFRPGLLTGATDTGACNAKDMLWKLLASGVAIGMHPTDGRPLPLAPVDVVARAIVELGAQPGSAGRAYNLVGADPVSVSRLFELLNGVGVGTDATDTAKWQDHVLEQARDRADEVLASMALYERSGHDFGGGRVEADAWRPWLSAHGLDVNPVGDNLRRSLAHLAAADPAFGRLLAPSESAAHEGNEKAS